MGQLTTDVDLAVVGGGPGGYTAAIRAAQLGLNVILIEKDKLGGTCTNLGCIPAKALIHAADVKHEAEIDNTKNMGIEATVKVDFEKTQKWKDSVVADIRASVEKLCKLNGVEIIAGVGFFTSSNALSVETNNGMRSIAFKKAIIATGTFIKDLPNLPTDHQKIINSNDVFSLKEIPKQLIIIGGGYIAVEMANLFMKFGSKVTIVHHGPRLLKRMEPDIASILLAKIKEMGGEVFFDSDVESFSGNTANLKTPDGVKSVVFDKLLVATGRVPALEELRLEHTEVKLDPDGFVIVDKTMKTTDENIYAVGDIVPGLELAHKAFKEGKVAAEVIAGLKSAFDNIAIPMVVFSDPEIAVVGLSEDEAKEQGYKVKIGKMPFSAVGKAKVLNRTEGFAKIVADENGVVLGVHIVGAGAGKLIAEGCLAIEMGALLEDVASTIHAHPTLPEILAEAAENALGRGIHIYKPKI